MLNIMQKNQTLKFVKYYNRSLHIKITKKSTQNYPAINNAQNTIKKKIQKKNAKTRKTRKKINTVRNTYQNKKMRHF